MANETKTIDYTLIDKKYHDQDLKKAKQQWRNDLFMQGVSKRKYKWTTILKSS